MSDSLLVTTDANKRTSEGEQRMPGHPPSVINDANSVALAHQLSNDDEARDRVKRAHILVVDESPDICDLLQLALTMAGYRVTVLVTTETWIGHAMQSDDPPALVLLDLSNPSLDVTLFLHDLRMRWPTAPPILVMTTSKHIYDEVATVERVMRKPFHLCDLLAEVERAILLAPQREHGWLRTERSS